MVVDLVVHSVRTPTRRPESDEVASKLMANPVRVLTKRAEQELDDRSRDPLRQAGDLPLSRRTDAQVEPG
jgi:hypothetical protein